MIPAWHPHTPFSGLSFNGWSFKKQPWFIPFISVLIHINTDRMTWVESYSTCYLFYFIFNWKKITLQYCDGFYYTSAWISHQFSSVQSLSCVWLFVTPWTAACQASLSITNSQSLLRLMFIESMMPSNHLILCLQSLPVSGSFPMSQFFTSGGQSIGASASQSFQWIFKTDFL